MNEREKLVRALKICGGEGQDCSGCPWEKKCVPAGGPNLLWMAADAIEALLKENAELRRDSEALCAALDIGTVAMERRANGG